mmetsp:Transcript_44855/g.100794  ORF Transcript_44855/g.100794 Transcript_44855/m.100794 type:complete len:318 (+) Transcript_44855:80-1033(+)
MLARAALLTAALLGSTAGLKGLRSEAPVRRGEGNETLSLTDVAIGIISARHMYMRGIHRAVLQHAPRGVILQAPGDGQCLCSIRSGFAALRKAYPRAKWYLVGNEDSFIHLERLREFLSQYNPDQPTVIAKDVALPEHPYSINYKCEMPSPWENTNMIWWGGSSHIISNRLANMLNYDSQCEVQGHVQKPDSDHTCFIARSAKAPRVKFAPLGHVTGTQTDPAAIGFGSVQKSDAEEIRSSKSILIASHLTPYELESLEDVNKNGVPHAMRMLPLAKNHGCNGRETDPGCNEMCRLRAVAPEPMPESHYVEPHFPNH